jgi:hypothetical protein
VTIASNVPVPCRFLLFCIRCKREV